MKVQVTIELGSSWDSYIAISNKLLLEDMDLIRKDDMRIIKFKRIKE